MLQPTSAPAVSVTGLLQGPLRALLQPMEPALHKLLSLDRLEHFYGMAHREESGAQAAAGLLRLLEIGYEFSGGGLDRIPATGPVVVVANHPFGLLEGVILGTVLPAVRPDVRILTNSVLAVLPELRERCIFVSPFGRQDAVQANASALKECIQWLRRGGLLAAFPAGEVAHFQWKDGCISDPHWNPAVIRIAMKTGAAAVPVFFQGSNSLAFQVAGTVHPGLRTMSLPRELLNKRGKRIRISVGRPVPPETLRGFPDSAAAAEYLRCRTYLMGGSAPAHHPFEWVAPALHLPSKKLAEPAPAVPPERLNAELRRLAGRATLCESHDLAVVLGRADEIPDTLREIGRLREISFRRAGEGTGRSIDLDRFDSHYLHLVLWNRKTDEVVGAYRLGETAEILPRHGIGGLYTSTLFRYRRDLFDAVGPAIELGRSFIRPEYQKQYAPLMLLWKGIARHAAERGCGVLFGGVSISNAYHPVSRHLIVRFLSAHRMERLAPMVSPRSPYRPHEPILRTAPVGRVPAGIDEVSALVADIEADGKGVPILVKQYHKAGGKLLGLNVDRKFSNALDALIMVDLRTAPRNLVERYTRNGGAARAVEPQPS